MKRQLVFIHGRAQEQKDSAALKAEWIDALKEGLAKSGLTLPIAEPDIRFPFFGDTLYDLVDGKTAGEAAQVIVRGDDTDEEEKRFTRAVIQAIRAKAGITDEQMAALSGLEVINRGPLNWEWFQAVLRAVDRHVPYGSGSSIALFTHDVYQYLKSPVIREIIDDGVRAALSPDVETVVVSHSLGTVIAYNLLRREGQMRGWKVPLFVTLGSPLAITEIRKTLKSFSTARCPECVFEWFNALDERDVVALYPLDTEHFPLEPADPAIDNKRDVRNNTSNRHGIAGYLDDGEVARRIHAALIA